LVDFEMRFRQGALPEVMNEWVFQAESADGIAVLQALKQAGLTASTSEAIRLALRIWLRKCRRPR